MSNALVIFAVTVAFLLQGCYGAKFVRQPVTVEETARDLEAMRQLQGSLEQRLQAMERRLGEQSELLRQIKAEESIRWQELESRLLAIDSRVRESDGGRPAYADIPIWSANAPRTEPRPTDRPGVRDTESTGPDAPPAREEKISLLPGGIAPADGAETSVDRHEDAGVVAPDQASPDPGVAAPISRDPEAKRLYDQAYLDLTRGNYSLAILGFREFLRISPESDLADNAQYWIGECYYAQRDFNQAIREFLTVDERYPHGDKVPAALLKAGYSFQALEDRAAARRYLNEVLTRFPNSDEAVLARNRLRTIG